MTQYFLDFSGDTPGNAPSAAWTAFGFSSTSGHKTGLVVDNSGTNSVRLRDIDWGQYPMIGYSHTGLGSYSPGGSEAVEMVAKFRLKSQTGFSGQTSSCAGLRMFGNYSLTPYDGTRWWLAEDYAGTPGDYIGGGSTIINRVCTIDVWYRMRFRRESNGVFKGQIWHDTDTDPGTTWDATSNPDTTVTSGAFSFFSFNGYSCIDFEWIGIGTQNDAAPMTGGGGPPPGDEANFAGGIIVLPY